VDIFNNPVLAKVIIGIGVVVLMILYGVGRMIYVSLSSKKNAPVKEVANRSREPMSGDESIGSISMRLGEDIRDVWEMGYSDDQINGVLTGKYTLAEMYKMGPEGNTTSAKGREILAARQK